MLIKQVHQKSVIFVTTGISSSIVLSFKPNVSNRCNDLLMMAMNLSNIPILNIKGSIISLISKNAVINVMQTTDLKEHYKVKKYKNF